MEKSKLLTSLIIMRDVMMNDLEPDSADRYYQWKQGSMVQERLGSGIVAGLCDVARDMQTVYSDFDYSLVKEWIDERVRLAYPDDEKNELKHRYLFDESMRCKSNDGYEKRLNFLNQTIAQLEQ